jgi:hypothetical protein
MTCSRFALDPNADPLHQVILLVPWALKIWIFYSLAIFLSFIGWVLLALALIKLISFASPVSERSIVRNPFRKPTIEELETAKPPNVNPFTLFSVAHSSISVALIFWDQSSSLWPPFLLATAALYSIPVALFVTSLVAVLTARILGIPLKTRNMGGGQRWPDIEQAHRSQEDDYSQQARCEAEEPSSETKLAEATSNMHLYTSPQSTYMRIFSGILANQTAAVTDSDVRGPENDAIDADSAIHLLINNGINPNSLTLSQIESFRAQDPDRQLKSIQVYKDNLAKMAYLQIPSSMTPARHSTCPNGGLDAKPSDLMFFQAPSPCEIPGNREAETAYLATMQEWHPQQQTFMAGRMQAQLLAAQALPREGPSIGEQAHNNAVPAVQPVIDSQTPLKLDGGIYKSEAPNDHRRPTNIGYYPPEAANPALQDYQMQLMLLDQQNKKRLLMVRQDQEISSRRAEEQE